MTDRQTEAGAPPETEEEARPTAGTPPEAAAELPPDPAEYDSERNALARARGLSAPYIAGGRDPEPEAGRREERFLLRLLVIMVVVIMLSGFVLGILINLFGPAGG
jgi:hypothetical protein